MMNVWILDRSEAGASELIAALPSLMYNVNVWIDHRRMLEALSESSPDLIVLEHGLAPVSAVEVLRAIKSADRRLPVIVVARATSSQGAIESMREGAYDYLPRETLPAGLEDAARRALSGDGGLIRTIGSPGPADVEELFAIVGKSPEMVEIHKLIGQVATTGAAVLITGESGTGKELIARAIHYNSARRAGPFVAVNCAALPDDLLDVELFGRRSRSTPDEREIGQFENADGGTIFLDEIDAATRATQDRVLAVLEKGHVERPGSRARIPVDVRVIAATGKSLVREMKEGRFGVALFYRLKVVSIYIPPLRERLLDIPYLAEYFLGEAKAKMRKEIDGISPAVFDLLKAYPWPGNVRELEQAIHRAIALNRTGVLSPEDFETLEEAAPELPGLIERGEGDLAAAVRARFATLSDAGSGDIDDRIISQVEESLARAAVDACDGSQVKAARLLGISRNTLRKRLRKSE
jgi:DNA-binding NtrC family response regulator